jgi:hypothetical protein
VKADYDLAFAVVSRDHPELMAAMHRPGRSPVNTWQPTDSDGETPERTPDKPFKPVGLTPAKEKKFGAIDTESPAQRAAKISRAVHA